MGILGIWKHACKQKEGNIRDLEAADQPIQSLNCKPVPNQHTLSCVIDAKVSSPVDDDALNRDIEALVQALQTIRLEDFSQAVAQTVELSCSSSLSHISSQTGTGEVEGIHETQGGGSGGATRGQVTGEVPPELGALVDAIKEDLLVLVLEGEVEGLGGEISDDIGKVTSPEGEESLLLGDTGDTVHDTLVLLICGDLLAGMLDLE